MICLPKLILLICLISESFSLESFSLSECKKTKACFKASNNCNIDSCDYIVTWKPKNFNGKLYLEFELIGNVKATGGYMTVGFSADQNLGDDSLVGCYFSPNENKQKVGFVVSYYNAGGDNAVIPLSDLDSDFLVATDVNKRYGGVFASSIRRLSCRFLRLQSPSKLSPKIKDLASGNAYYLLVMRGNGLTSFTLNSPSPGTVIFSKKKLDFTSGTFLTDPGSSNPKYSVMAKVHGILMIIAWILFCGIAVIMARYYKLTWPAPDSVKYKRRHEGQWFKTHRALQSLAFVLIFISIIIIFVHVKGYSRLENMPGKLHPILGLISCCLFVINPFIALCRCSKLKSKRPCFNWSHFIIGTIAYILAIPSIMLGLRLPGAGPKLYQLVYPQIIVIMFVIFQFIVEIILEIHGCKKYNQERKRFLRYDKELEEYEMALDKGVQNLREPNRPKQVGRKFLLFMLSFYIIVCFLVTLTLSIIIILN